jgi:Holliday junction resolvase RusA-like endonuclease
MTGIEFTIPGRIGGKGRPRAFMYRDKKLHTLQVGHYTPQKTEKTEDLIRFYAREAMKGQEPFHGPLHLGISIVLNPAKSWSKKKKAAAIWVTGKPDADNIIKSIGDALNQIVFYDDAQIARIIFQRRYDNDAKEFVRVAIAQLNGAGV